MKRVMVFGVFDGLHGGHRAFLRQAKECGDALVVAVARDETVEILKGRKPRKDLRVRIHDLRESGLADEVVGGDTKIGSWEVIGKYEPDVIALGYDQERLRAALTEFIRAHDLDIEVRMMEAHEPERYHSSILNQE